MDSMGIWHMSRSKYASHSDGSAVRPISRLMTAHGYERTLALVKLTSALPPEADISVGNSVVRL